MVATVRGMDYLLTWNCKHIANAILLPKIGLISTELAYEPPIICTPQELWEILTMWKDLIIEEIHKHRDEYLKQFDYDIHSICKDIRKKLIITDLGEPPVCVPLRE